MRTYLHQPVSLSAVRHQMEPTMTQTIIQSGNRAVVITAQDSKFSARLYVNARDGISNADATLMTGSFKTAAGAHRWAGKALAA